MMTLCQPHSAAGGVTADLSVPCTRVAFLSASPHTPRSHNPRCCLSASPPAPCMSQVCGLQQLRKLSLPFPIDSAGLQRMSKLPGLVELLSFDTLELDVLGPAHEPLACVTKLVTSSIDSHGKPLAALFPGLQSVYLRSCGDMEALSLRSCGVGLGVLVAGDCGGMTDEGFAGLKVLRGLTRLHVDNAHQVGRTSCFDGGRGICGLRALCFLCSICWGFDQAPDWPYPSAGLHTDMPACCKHTRQPAQTQQHSRPCNLHAAIFCPCLPCRPCVRSPCSCLTCRSWPCSAAPCQACSTSACRAAPASQTQPCSC